VVHDLRESCRLAATECLELARLTADPENRRALMAMAQAWLKAAYSPNIIRFEQVTEEFNQWQLGDRHHGLSEPRHGI
jgi:hypothetical protein